jgi:hypothetical protein
MSVHKFYPVGTLGSEHQFHPSAHQKNILNISGCYVSVRAEIPGLSPKGHTTWGFVRNCGFPKLETHGSKPEDFLCKALIPFGDKIAECHGAPNLSKKKHQKGEHKHSEL